MIKDWNTILLFNKPPKIGKIAPDFELPSHLGEKVRLSDYRGKKNVLLAFFPMSWTRVCSEQIPGYERDLKRFEDLNTQVLAVSVDSIPTLQAWQKSLGGILYPILSDYWPHGAISKKYGILTEGGFADRVVFIIDKDGIIRDIDPVGVKVVPDNEKVLEFLKKLN